MTLSSRDQHAIADFQRGSYSAVKELYDEYYDELLDFATHLILNKAEAHHIVQETFIKLFLMRHRFHKEPDIKAFLYITVRNICFACIKSEKDIESDEEPNWYEQSLKNTARFEEEPTRREALYKMQNQVRELPEAEQIVFTALFCDRLTIPAAAEQLGLTPVAITYRRIRAIQLLRDSFAATDLFSIPLFIYFIAVESGNRVGR
jgi:RNA polymerase sigma factor (sigma-70 family)